MQGVVSKAGGEREGGVLVKGGGESLRYEEGGSLVHPAGNRVVRWEVTRASGRAIK